MRCYQTPSLEPPLDEILADPIIRLVLQRDRVQVTDLVRLLDEIRERLKVEESKDQDVTTSTH